MKSVSFVPKTIPAGGASQSPLGRLLVDRHRSKRCIFIICVVQIHFISVLMAFMKSPSVKCNDNSNDSMTTTTIKNNDITAIPKTNKISSLLFLNISNFYGRLLNFTFSMISPDKQMMHSPNMCNSYIVYNSRLNTHTLHNLHFLLHVFVWKINICFI